jgi:hypothetical protein
MSDKNKLNSLKYYYKNKERLDKRRKELYQQQKYKIIKIINEPIINEPTIKINQRVLNRCKLIIKYELLLNKIKSI